MAVASEQVGMDGRMMTLEEEIKHCEDVANDQTGCCEECAEEHRQLAEWLKELKAYRQMTESEKVTCITCGHLDIRDAQGQATPVRFCRAENWEKIGQAPHQIMHDESKPILCDLWKPKGETDGCEPKTDDRSRILRAVGRYIQTQAEENGLKALGVNGYVYGIEDVLQELDAVIREEEGEA